MTKLDGSLAWAGREEGCSGGRLGLRVGDKWEKGTTLELGDLGLMGPGLIPSVMGQLGGCKQSSVWGWGDRGGGGLRWRGIQVEVGCWLKACGLTMLCVFG